MQFVDFKRIMGCSSKELEVFTGYTRQGLHSAFAKLHETGQATAKFRFIIEHTV